MLIISIVLTAVAAYLLGGINGAIIISKHIFKKDVRTFGSGNAGLTNFMRAFGRAWAAGVIGIDFLKGVAACVIGGLLLSQLGYGIEGRALGGLFVILGHMFPVYYGFKGGKGIMTGAAVGLMIDWRILVTILIIFILGTAFSRIVSVGSVLAATGFPLSCVLFDIGGTAVLVITTIMASMVIFMHRGNIARIIKGEENRLTMDQFRKQ